MTDFEREDLELAAVMGGRFQDMTEAGKPDEKPVEKPVSGEQKKPVKNVPEKEKTREALWKPVKPAPNYMDKLKAVAKEVGLYGLLSTILFYWQQTGKLDYTTAWHALLVCVGMVFFSVGKNWRGGVN